MDKQIFVLYVGGHANGRKEIMSFQDTMAKFNLTSDKLRELIESGDEFEGKCFDEAFYF